MRHTTMTLILFVFIISCGQNNNKQKELELKEKELALKEKELELKEKNSTQDTAAQIPNTNQPENPSSPEEIVLNINEEIKKINSLPLTKTTFKVKDGGCESYNGSYNGFTIDYFINDKEIQKIVASQDYAEQEGGPESMIYETKEKIQYYYKERKFIFSHQILEVSMGEPGGKSKPTKSEFRKYVKNDKIIQTKGDKSISKSENKELTSSSKEYKVLKAFSNKDFAAALCE